MPKTLTVSGYKAHEMGIFKTKDPRIDYIKKALRKRLVERIEDGIEWIITSGQLGVETWALEVSLELKQSHDVKVGIIAPFEEQDSRWNEENKARYQTLIESVDYYDVLYKGPYKNPSQFKMRNAWYLEKCDESLLLVDDLHPGSVKYYLNAARPEAESGKHTITYITPFDLDELIREEQEKQY